MLCIRRNRFRQFRQFVAVGLVSSLSGQAVDALVKGAIDEVVLCDVEALAQPFAEVAVLVNEIDGFCTGLAGESVAYFNRPFIVSQ